MHRPYKMKIQTQDLLNIKGLIDHSVTTLVMQKSHDITILCTFECDNA